jgi:hypothetical protein
MSIHDTIAELGEREALRVLALVVDHGGDLPDPVRSREIEERIREAADEAAQPVGQPVSAAELARETLTYLADTPEFATVIGRAVAIPPDGSRLELSTLALGALILIAVQTEVKLTRSEKGRWSLLIHKPSMDDSRLVSLIDKLLAYYRNLNR